MLERINGYLAVPHELLHVVAYRLIGKRCHYQVGNCYVTATETLSTNEKLFVLLFPFLVTFVIAFSTLALWMGIYIAVSYPVDPIEYFQSAPIWHQLLWLIGTLSLLYLGTSWIDLVKVAQILFQNLRQQPPHQSNHQ